MIKGEFHPDSMPIVKILVRGHADPSVIQWNEKAANHPQFQHIDRGDIITSFQALFADAESATWRP
eukprot:7869083-Pyramimonas_sp.AAC.1